MTETCQRCGDEGPNLRTLWHSCVYEMSELGVPFYKDKIYNRIFYTLSVCKSCRADWMSAIQEWFTAKPKPSCGSGIFIRENGTSREITYDEWCKINYPKKSEKMKTDILKSGFIPEGQ